MAMRGKAIGYGLIVELSGNKQGMVFQDLDSTTHLFFLTKHNREYFIARHRVTFIKGKKK